ncbi:MAG: hypothetical protein WDM81_05880 [Rhizomicrobium sp.]
MAIHGARQRDAAERHALAIERGAPRRAALEMLGEQKQSRPADQRRLEIGDEIRIGRRHARRGLAAGQRQHRLEHPRHHAGIAEHGLDPQPRQRQDERQRIAEDPGRDMRLDVEPGMRRLQERRDEQPDRQIGQAVVQRVIDQRPDAERHGQPHARCRHRHRDDQQQDACGGIRHRQRRRLVCEPAPQKAMRMRGAPGPVRTDADRGQRVLERDMGDQRRRPADDHRLRAHGPPARRARIATAVISTHARSVPTGFSKRRGVLRSIVTGSWPCAKAEQTLATSPQFPIPVEQDAAPAYVFFVNGGGDGKVSRYVFGLPACFIPKVVIARLVRATHFSRGQLGRPDKPGDDELCGDCFQPDAKLSPCRTFSRSRSASPSVSRRATKRSPSPNPRPAD